MTFGFNKNRELFHRIAGLVVIVALALGAAGCVGTETKEEAQPQAAQASAQELVAPVPIMPAPPAERSTGDLWKEADKRSESLKPMVERQIASVVPGPYPEAKKKKPKRKKSKATAQRSSKRAAPTRTSRVETASVDDSASIIEGAIPELVLMKKFTTKNGLPNNLITAIFVDKTEAWVGTSGGGVAHYIFAEENWIVQGEADGLISNHITDIVKFKGKVYVGTKRGVSVWDGISWSNLEEIERVQLLNVNFTLKEKALWISARNMRGGVLEFDGEKWKDRSTMRSGIVLNNVSDFDFDGKDIWIGTTSRGLYSKRGKAWKTHTVSDGIASNFIYTLAVKGGRAYLGGCCGISYYDGAVWVVYDVPEGLPHSTVNAISWEGQYAWLGSKNGLSLFDGSEFYNFYAEDGLLADNHVTSLFNLDDELWVGTVGGLSRLKMEY